MSFHVSHIDDPDEWNSAIERLPLAHILQSYQWGTLKRMTGWRQQNWLFQEEGDPVAAAMVLTRSVAKILSVQYVPKGPLLDFSDLDLLDEVLGFLEDNAFKKRAIFVKIDPDVDTDSEVGRKVVSVLRKRGWIFSNDQIQFPNTLVLDLRPSEEELLRNMKQKTRYNVRLAARRGVEVRSGGVEDLRTFYRLYSETSERDGFVIRPYGYYERVWKELMSAGMAHLLLAEVGGEPVAGLILFKFAGKAWYFYGASSSRHRNLMPNYLLQWEAIRWAKSQGCTEYDFWGAPTELSEKDPMWGVYRFKIGFGAKLVRHVGAWDFPTERKTYWVYTRVMPEILSLMRWSARRFRR